MCSWLILSRIVENNNTERSYTLITTNFKNSTDPFCRKVSPGRDEEAGLRGEGYQTYSEDLTKSQPAQQQVPEQIPVGGVAVQRARPSLLAGGHFMDALDLLDRCLAQSFTGTSQRRQHECHLNAEGNQRNQQFRTYQVATFLLLVIKSLLKESWSSHISVPAVIHPVCHARSMSPWYMETAPHGLWRTLTPGGKHG